ncbi:chemotaxis protein CheB [Okeanomitos corallinicola TIOX110]|uniref:protein-glutamate methylesterase n=1 Tax=Okeanomitos corallinicola TIOX110 TaxID=3133117 RepID=A0ABZ2UYX4_9CYAN
MNLESSTQIEPATKILCIGASTYNTGTPQVISQALQETNLLNDWAIIWAVHDYFVIPKKENCINDIINYNFHEIKEHLIFVDENFNYLIQKGYLYILPDSYWVNAYPEKRIISRIIIDKNILMIEASNSEEIYQEEFDYVDNIENPNGIDNLPCIDKIMIQLADNHTGKIAGLLLAGLGKDGAKGMLAINRKGGKTAVQNPEECKHDRRNNTYSMPITAITEAKNEGRSHEIITLNIQKQANTNDIKTLTEWLEFIKNN